MPYIETNDHTRLFYQDWGTGQPVVFIHGWTLHAGMWEYQLSYLTGQGLRCVAYDRRGHGRSDQPGRGYDYDTLADDLAALLERLDLRAVTLVAHSMGGGEIARYLTRHGAGRIARAVFLAAVAPFPLKTVDNSEGLDKSYFDATVAALCTDRPGWFAAGAPAYFGAEQPTAQVSDALMQDAVRMCRATPLPVAIACLRTLTETDLRPDLRTLTVPTVVIHGDADRSAPIDMCGRRIAQLVPGCALTVYKGAPHGLYVRIWHTFDGAGSDVAQDC